MKRKLVGRILWWPFNKEFWGIPKERHAETLVALAASLPKHIIRAIDYHEPRLIEYFGEYDETEAETNGNSPARPS